MASLIAQCEIPLHLAFEWHCHYYSFMSKRDDNHDDDASWSNIDFNEIELGDRIGGGGAGIIYQGENDI